MAKLLFLALCISGTTGTRLNIQKVSSRDGGWVVSTGDDRDLVQVHEPSLATDKDMIESKTVGACIEQVQEAHRSVTIASLRAFTSKSKDKEGAREEPISAALEVWCNEKFFLRQAPLPQEMTVQLCHDLKSAVDSDLEKGKLEDFDTISAKFCQQSQRAISQALNNEVRGDELMGADLIPRFQFGVKRTPVSTFYGTRAHDSLEEAEWDPHASCCKPHRRKGCNNATVAQCVCSLDLFCCQSNWDEQCKQSVEELKCGVCGSPSSIGTDNSTKPTTLDKNIVLVDKEIKEIKKLSNETAKAVPLDKAAKKQSNETAKSVPLIKAAKKPSNETASGKLSKK